MRAVLLVAAVGVGFVVFATPAAAHNTLEAAEPADGSVLQSTPDQFLLRFVKDVPLDTASLDLIDRAGARTALDPRRGASRREVVALLPTGLQGPLTVRWRLVGPDGHVVSARVGFTVEGPVAGVPADGTAATPGGPPPAKEAAEASGLLRFGVRFVGFVAATALGGIIPIALLVSPSLTGDHRVRVVEALAMATVGLTALMALWILASDIGGSWPSMGFGDIAAALGLDAGVASLVRVVVTGALAGLLFAMRGRMDDRTRWQVAGGLMLVLLATWSYAGHARAGRWAWLGVPLDVIHYASAAAWLGGLLLMVGVVLPGANADGAVVAVRRFSAVASFAVVALVGTGVVQGIRLIGGPLRLLGSGHGRLLLAKLVVLGGMLYVANINRKRVQRRFAEPSSASPGMRRALRRAMVTESSLGLAVLAVTALLVVTTPAMGANAAPQAHVATDARP